MKDLRRVQKKVHEQEREVLLQQKRILEQKQEILLEQKKIFEQKKEIEDLANKKKPFIINIPGTDIEITIQNIAAWLTTITIILSFISFISIMLYIVERKISNQSILSNISLISFGFYFGLFGLATFLCMPHILYIFSALIHNNLKNIKKDNSYYSFSWFLSFGWPLSVYLLSCGWCFNETKELIGLNYFYFTLGAFMGLFSFYHLIKNRKLLNSDYLYNIMLNLISTCVFLTTVQYFFKKVDLLEKFLTTFSFNLYIITISASLIYPAFLYITTTNIFFKKDPIKCVVSYVIIMLVVLTYYWPGYFYFFDQSIKMLNLDSSYATSKIDEKRKV